MQSQGRTLRVDTASRTRWRCALAVGVVAHVLAGCAPVPDRVQSDFDFTTQAFSFSNFGTEDRGSGMTELAAIRMFGREAVCLPGATATECTPRPEAAAWIAEVNQTLAYGHSEGFAVTALLMSLGKLSPADFGAPTAAGLSKNNERLQRELAYWSATQKLGAAHERDERYAAKDVMPFLARILKPGQTEAYRLLVTMREGDGLRGGHALVPFGYFKGEREGLYYLRVYDSNIPQAEQRLEIDVTANTWRYEGSFDTALDRSYVGTAANGNLLWFSPVTARLGTFLAPFTEGARLSVSATGANLRVEGDGTNVGFKDGQLVEQGGRLTPAAADCLCRSPNEIVNIQLSADAGTGPQTVKVSTNGFSDTQSVQVTGPGVSVTADGVKANSGNDQLVVDSSGKKVSYDTGGDSKVDLTTTFTSADGATTKVTVTVGDSAREVVVDGSDSSNVKVQLDDLPPGTQVTVTVTKTAADGTSKTTSVTATTTAGKDAEVKVQPDTGTSQTNTNIVFEQCLNGRKDMSEGDVDCGASCASMAAADRNGDGLCGLSKTCGTDADCGNQNCVSGRCAEPSCTDGRKNGRETDVDCGAPALSCLCGEGKRCDQTSQCAAGLECLRNTCLSGTRHTLSVVGLPVGESFELGQTVDGAYSRVTIAGQPAASFMHRFDAKDSFTVGISSSGFRVACALDTPTWSWVRNPDAGVRADVQSNTARCQRRVGQLLYDTQLQTCPYFVDGRFLEGAAPTLSVTRFVPREAAQTAVTLLEPRRQGVVGAIHFQPDAGLAYRINSLNSPVVRQLKTGARVDAEFIESCAIVDAGSGFFPASGTAAILLSCSCVRVPDGGLADAGPPDAGAPDAGPPDAGPPDAGMDGGPSALPLGAMCQLDSQCASLDCECGANSGACTSNSGRCGAGKVVFSTPTTDGVAVSGTFTVPTGCPTIRLAAWGAAGGNGSEQMPFPMSYPGGAGGFLSGTLAAAPGDVFSVWVGGGGTTSNDPNWPRGMGSYAGTAANGGYGRSETGIGALMAGGGGGLTSVRQAGSAMVTVSVPGGGGGSRNGNSPGGDTAGGNAPTRAGGHGTMFTSAGGGGAGENGGLGGTSNGAFGLGGAFAASLPSGLVGAPGSGQTPVGSSVNDLSLCPSGTGAGSLGTSIGGDGCVVLRCVAP